MPGQNTPCYKDGVHCSKRHVGCQSTCPDYMAFYRRNVEVVYPARERYALANMYTSEQKKKSVIRGGGKL